MRLLSNALEPLIQVGTLDVFDHAGRCHRFEGSPAPRVAIRLHDRSVELRLAFNPELGLGEAYMNGRLTVEGASIYDLLDLLGRNFEGGRWLRAQRIRQRLGLGLRRFHQPNSSGRARANVAHHYDLSRRLFDLFLDHDRQYSCAYFPTGRESLDEAQAAKKRLIATKLRVEPGQRVLDIGSGWGGLALHLAETAQARVTGITLSSEQLAFSQARAREVGRSQQVRFQLCDYRDVGGTFDRIVSVGMFEHVGVSHYDDFFGKVRTLLADDGLALLHTIGRSDGPGVTDAWTRKYIFPGGYVPALSEVAAAIERSGLVITDIEILRLHYAETLRRWRERFATNRDQAKALYDERFCRMWEYYLAASEMSFRHLGNVVFQFQLAKRQTAAPLTRDYLIESTRPDESMWSRRSA